MKRSPPPTQPKTRIIGGVLYVRDAFGTYAPYDSEPPYKLKIRKCSDCLPALIPFRYAKVESFVVLTLDSANQLIMVHEITRGLVNKSLVHPREVFNRAIGDMATAIIIVHNHPSGSLDPSAEDLVATRKLVDASKILSIPILDHLIISRNGFTSIRERFGDYFS